MVIENAAASELPGKTGTVRGRESLRIGLRLLLVFAFLAAGFLHILKPEPFVRIVPLWVPFARETVIVTGFCEIFGAVGLLISRLRWIAGIMLAAYTVCVYPANIQHALMFAHHGTGWNGWLYHGPRLLFQPVIVWWCLFAGRVIDWPFTGTSQAGRHPRHPPQARKE